MHKTTELRGIKQHRFIFSKMTVKWNEYLIEQFPVTEYADLALHYFHKQQDISATMSLTYILAGMLLWLSTFHLGLHFIDHRNISSA